MAGAFEAGAGQIGAYRECSFAIPGQGTFFGTETTDPTVGQRGRRETVAELRLEVVCPAERLAAVFIIDPWPSFVRGARDRRLSAPRNRVGSVVSRSRPAPGALAGSSSHGAWASSRRSSAASSARVSVPMVGDPQRPVLRVAVACGAGDDFLNDAARLRSGCPAHGRGAIPSRSRGRGAGTSPWSPPVITRPSESVSRTWPSAWPSPSPPDPLAQPIRTRSVPDHRLSEINDLDSPHFSFRVGSRQKKRGWQTWLEHRPRRLVRPGSNPSQVCHPRFLERLSPKPRRGDST